MFRPSKRKRGLTVIELVVTVVAILTIGAVTPSLYRSFAIKIRDARRLHHIEELRSALHTYYFYTGNYPIATTPDRMDGTDAVSVALKKSFLVLGTRLPVDPLSPQMDYRYQSLDNGKGYVLTYCLEAYTDANHTANCTNQAYPREDAGVKTP